MVRYSTEVQSVGMVRTKSTNWPARGIHKDAYVLLQFISEVFPPGPGTEIFISSP